MSSTWTKRVVAAAMLSVFAMGVPAVAQAKPSGVVVEATSSKVMPHAVAVNYSLKGPAVLTMVVQRVRGTSAVVARVQSRTGVGQLSWNRHLNGRVATPGRYVITLVAAKGTAKSQSSITVTLN